MNTHLKIGEVAKILGVDTQTVRAWSNNGKLDYYKTPNGHRRFDKAYIERLARGEELQKSEVEIENNLYIYARVSTKKQEEAGNLDRQISRLTQYSLEKGYKIEGIFKEVGSGINENRRQLMKLLNEVKSVKNATVLVEYRDRLARFGFEYLKKYIEDNGSKLVVLEENNKDEERELELVEDLMAITTSFSARIYGKRGGKKVVEKVENALKGGELNKNDEASDNRSS
ncbi:MAG: IS607 family transposase [Halobacillus sp.]|uniref:IS607 family transposase n=1 Tax=Halobacillus sp. TaxID=56800 RepID=UPI003BAFCEAB